MRRVAAASAILLLVPLFSRPGDLLISAQAQSDDRPSIVLIVTDDQRPETLSAMPVLLERLVAHGARFGNAYVPHALCCPARASILTGNHSHTTNVWRNTLEGGYANFDESSTLATWLQDAGYRTGLFGKYLNHWADVDPTHVPQGWDAWFAFRENCCSYYGFDASIDGSVTSFGDDVYSATESAQRAAEFLLAQPEAPTFVMWTPDGPHAPAHPEVHDAGSYASLPPSRPPNYMEKDVSDKPAWVRAKSIWAAPKRQDVDALRRRMFESMRSVDAGLRVIMDALAASDRLSNTLIVFTSDNGLLLGEHRSMGKAFPWKAGHQVPFVVRYDPLLGSRRSSNEIILTIDIAPTIAELVGMEAPPMDGTSLLPILRGDRLRVRARALIEHGQQSSSVAPPYCGVRTRYELFVRYPTREEEYYDYRADPWELDDRSSAPSKRTRVANLRRWVRAHCSPTPPGFAW
ncbi:MAG TPA: sulfatase [Actinomycetota bacterium]|nr:sulfatase [Actinomycetota bacterium]